jgi:hypothetical protein
MSLFFIYTICLMTSSCTLLQAYCLCVDWCVCVCVCVCMRALCYIVLYCCFICAEVVPHLVCVWCRPSLMIFIAASIVSQKICQYVYMWNCKKFKYGYFLMCWLLSLQVVFFSVLLRQSTPLIQNAKVGEYFSLLMSRTYIRSNAFKLLPNRCMCE